MTASSRHLPGRWVPAAGQAVQDIRLGIPALPNRIEVHEGYWREIRLFFREILLAFTKEERGPWNDSYRLAMRALGFCLDNPLVVVEGKVVGIATMEEADTKLVSLLDHFFENESVDPEDWKELADFLERVRFLDEADMLARPMGHLIVGSRTRLH